MFKVYIESFQGFAYFDHNPTLYMRMKFHNFFKIYNGFFLSNFDPRFDLWNLSRAYLHKKQLEKTGFFIYNFQRIYLNQIFNSKCCTFFYFQNFIQAPLFTLLFS